MAPRATKLLRKPKPLRSAFSLTASITAKASRSFTAFSQLADELADKLGQSRPGRTPSHRLVNQAAVRISSDSAAQRLARFCFLFPRPGRDRAANASPNRETHRTQTHRSLIGKGRGQVETESDDSLNRAECS